MAVDITNIEQSPWWAKRLHLASVYGLLLVTGDTLVISKVIGMRKLGPTLWLDFVWHTTKDEEADLKSKGLPNTRTWEQARAKLIEKGTGAAWMPKRLIQAPSKAPYGSVRLDHIVSFMEFIDAE